MPRPRSAEELLVLFVKNSRRFGFTKDETRTLLKLSDELRSRLDAAAFDEIWDEATPQLALEDTLPEAKAVKAVQR